MSRQCSSKVLKDQCSQQSRLAFFAEEQAARTFKTQAALEGLTMQEFLAKLMQTHYPATWQMVGKAMEA